MKDDLELAAPGLPPLVYKIVRRCWIFVLVAFLVAALLMLTGCVSLLWCWGHPNDALCRAL